MSRPARPGAAVAAALLLATAAGCTIGEPTDRKTPAPTSTVQVTQPGESASPSTTATAPTANPTDTTRPEHGPVDPTATNEPTDAAYLSVKQVSAEFVAAFYDFGYPDLYARDHLDKSQPYMTDRFFFEQLDILEDAGANADPTWQQITTAQTRSTVEVGTVIPGYVNSSKAVSRVAVRIAIVAANSHGRTEGVPAAAPVQYVLLHFAKVMGAWRVDNSEVVDS